MSNAVCFASFAIGQLDTAMNQLIAHSETSLGMMQFRLLHEHYQMLCQSVSEAFPLETRWRSLPKGIQPLRLVWDCTNVLSESACHYLQPLATPETVMLLEPSMLERYREVSLLPVSVTDDERAEQLVTSGLLEIALDKRIDQLVNEEMARSLNAFQQLLDTIEHKQRR